VGLAIRSGPAAQLEREADRLMALLEAGRAASRASGAPVRWMATTEGFRFEGVAPESLPDRWLAPGVVVQAPAGLVLGPEPFIGAQQVQLTHVDAPGQALRIATDGLRPFALKAEP
jgi:general secretion pathway protein H